jgi:hypothetical protein
MFKYESTVAISIPKEVAIVAGLCPTLCMLFACAAAESFTVSGCRVAETFSVVEACAGAALAVGRDCIATDCVTLEIAMDAIQLPRFPAGYSRESASVWRGFPRIQEPI